MEKILNKTCLMLLLCCPNVAETAKSKPKTTLEDQNSLTQKRVKSAVNELYDVAKAAESKKATNMAEIFKAMAEALNKCYEDDPNGVVWLTLFSPGGYYTEGSIAAINDNEEVFEQFNVLAKESLVQIFNGEILPKFSSAEELMDSSIAFWKDVVKLSEENPRHNAWTKSAKTYLQLFELVKFHELAPLVYATNDLAHCGDFKASDRYAIAAVDWMLLSLSQNLAFTESEIAMISIQVKSMLFTYSKFVIEYCKAKAKNSSK